MVSSTSLNANCIPLEAGSSTGKTSLIVRLSELGYSTVSEVATAIIKSGLTPAHGRRIFQDRCLACQQEAEAVTVGSKKIWFLDRGLLIGRAHYVDELLPIPKIYDELDVSHYLFAFIIEPLEIFEHNGVRPEWENLDWSRHMTNLVEAEYKRRGILTIRVPPFPSATEAISIDRRVAFMLDHCRRLIPDFNNKKTELNERVARGT